MDQTDSPKTLARREFLRAAGGATAGAAAVAPLLVLPAEARETRSEKVKQRYRLSDHVKTYYRVNRY